MISNLNSIDGKEELEENENDITVKVDGYYFLVSKSTGDVSRKNIEVADGEVESGRDQITVDAEEYNTLKNTVEELALDTYRKSEVNALFENFSTSSEEVTYSNTEQAIGKWIDGKTIYRKIFIKEYATLATFSSGTNIYGENYDLKDIDIIIETRLLTTGNSYKNQEESNALTLRYINDLTHIETYIIYPTANYAGISRYIAIFEYTKK